MLSRIVRCLMVNTLRQPGASRLWPQKGESMEQAAISSESASSAGTSGRRAATLLVGATALFAIAMVIIGSQVQIDGRGTGLLLALADRLGAELGAAGRWMFLVGVLGAVVSSLLGVWQAVPYLFADLWSMTFVRHEAGAARPAVDTRAAPYRVYLWLLALVPMLGLVLSFKEIQKLYATMGATFIPLLALALLLSVAAGSAGLESGWLEPLQTTSALAVPGAIAVTVSEGFSYGVEETWRGDGFVVRLTNEGEETADVDWTWERKGLG